MAINLYALLGLTADAHPDVIKAAYRALAKQYHPDGEGAGNPEATAKFIELQNAYEVLGNPATRAEYDASLSNDVTEDIEVEPEASIDPDEIWLRRAQEHPEINPIHEILHRYSPALANRFRLAVIDDECPHDPASFAADLERQYFRKYFGEDPNALALARQLLGQGNRAAAKELNIALKTVQSTDQDGLRRLLASFERKYGNANSKHDAEASQLGSARPLRKTLLVLPVALVLLIAVSLSIYAIHFAKTVQNPVEADSNVNPTTPKETDLHSSSDSKGSLTPTTEVDEPSDSKKVGGKAIYDRIPENEPPSSGGSTNSQIVPERDLNNGNLYPEVTAGELPYSEDRPVIIDAENVTDNEQGTTLTKQSVEPFRQYAVVRLDRPFLDVMTSRGVSENAAKSIEGAVNSVFPVSEIPADVNITLTLDRQFDFAGQETWFPSELLFSVGSRGTVTVTADKDGVFHASIDRGKRRALVIGNANYRTIPWLSNPDEDAALISKSLSELGFEVTRLVDGDERAMKAAIQLFSRSLNAGTEIALVFYSGHAVEINSQNYLLPVDISSKSSEERIVAASVSLSEVLREMERRHVPTKIVIVDACRNNPFGEATSSRGLAAVVAPSGTFVAYATAPGTVALDGDAGAANSPYSVALAAALKTPAPSIEDTFKAVRTDVMRATNGEQVPWDGSSLIGAISFAPVSAPAQIHDFQSEWRSSSEDGKVDLNPVLESPPPLPVPHSAVESAPVAKPRPRPPIVKLEPADQVKPVIISPGPRSSYTRASDYEVCYQAVDAKKDEWDARDFEQAWVSEAHRRGFTINGCLAKIGRAIVLPMPSAGQQG